MEAAEPPPARDASYFDQWYAGMESSPDRDAIVARTLGLPPELQSTSLLTWAGIAEVTQALRLPSGGRLADLACGRGGYGIEIARRTGADLPGVDFSEVALGQARRAAERLLPGRSGPALAGHVRVGAPRLRDGHGSLRAGARRAGGPRPAWPQWRTGAGALRTGGPRPLCGSP